MKFILSIVWIALIVMIMSIQAEKIAIVDSNQAENPGVKLTIQQNTLDYLTKQMLPFIEKQVGNLAIPDINTEIKTPIGHVSLSVTSMHLSTVHFPSATIKIASGNNLVVIVSSATASAKANWHYREKSWPHISDHGSADISININVQATLGANLDPSHKSGIKITSTQFDLHFNSFHLKLHGGASWLYNIFINILKHNIESSISKQLHNQIPHVIETQLQTLLDSVDMQVKMPFDVLLSFDPREINFAPSTGSITLGSLGAFVKKGVDPYPGSPTVMPDSVNNKMIQIFISEYVLNTAGWAYQEAGVMQAVIHAKDVPANSPIQLNTTYWGLVAPGLVQKYPNNLMQVTVHTSEAPKATMDSNGITVDAKVAADFQVITTDGKVEDAFVTELDIIVSLNASMSVVDGKNSIVGTVTYKSATGKIASSNVGDVNFEGIFILIELVIEYGIIPLVNTFTKKGFVIPSIQFASLINPNIVVDKGYLMVYSDFTWTPSSKYILNECMPAL